MDGLVPRRDGGVGVQPHVQIPRTACLHGRSAPGTATDDVAHLHPATIVVVLVGFAGQQTSLGRAQVGKVLTLGLRWVGMDGAQISLLEGTRQLGIVVPAIVRQRVEAQQAGRNVCPAVAAIVVVLVAGPKHVVDGISPIVGGLPLGVGGVRAENGLVEGVARIEGTVQNDGRGTEPLCAQGLALKGTRTSGHQHGTVGIVLHVRFGRGAEPRQQVAPFPSVWVEVGVVGLAVGLGAKERVVGGGENDFHQRVGRIAGAHGGVAPERCLTCQQGEALSGGGRRDVDGPRGEDGHRGADRPQKE